MFSTFCTTFSSNRSLVLWAVATYLLFCICQPGYGQGGNTLTVDPNGGGQFFTIQDAIDNSESGDTIVITPEDFQELLTISNKDLKLCSSVPGQKVKVDGNQMGATCLFSSDDPMTPVTVELIDFEIKGGSSGGIETFDVNLFLMNCNICQCSSVFEGGGIFQIGGSLSAVDLTVSENMAGSDGGGIFSFDGDLSFLATEISDNISGRDGGGLFQLDGSSPQLPLISLSDAEIKGNCAMGNGGGLLTIDIPDVKLCASDISDNDAMGVGGGATVAAIANDVLLTIDESLFENNKSTGAGGGIFVQDTQAELNNVSILGNESGNASGGGIYGIGGIINVEGAVIENNLAAMNGGGIQLVDADPNDAQKLINVLLKNNIASQNGGGFSVTDPNSLVAFIKSEVVDNQAMNGGGIFVGNAKCDIVNSRVMSNDADQGGGGFYNNAGEVNAINTIVDGNTAVSPGGGFFNNMGSCSVTNCNLVGNVSPIGGGGFTAENSTTNILNTISVENGTLQLIEVDTGSIDAHNSIIEGGFSGTDIQDVNADFVDTLGPDGMPATGDENYNLNPNSLAIDAGNNLFVPMDQHDVDWDGDFAEQVPHDHNCQPRFQNGPNTGEGFLGGVIVDIGAIEFQEQVVLLGDINGDGLVNLLDVEPFVAVLNSGAFQAEADINSDGAVNLLDIESFVELLSGS